MTTKEMLKSCSVCKNRQMDKERGLLCSLTHKKPDFTGECPSYSPDPIAIQYRAREEERVHEKELDNKTLGLSKYGVRNISIAAGIVMTLSLLWIITGILYLESIFYIPVFIFLIAMISLVQDQMKGNKDSSREYKKMKESDLLDDL